MCICMYIYIIYMMVYEYVQVCTDVGVGEAGVGPDRVWLDGACTDPAIRLNGGV